MTKNAYLTTDYEDSKYLHNTVGSYSTQGDSETRRGDDEDENNSESSVLFKTEPKVS